MHAYACSGSACFGPGQLLQLSLLLPEGGYTRQHDRQLREGTAASKSGSMYCKTLTSGVRGSSQDNGQAKHNGGELGHLVRVSASIRSTTRSVLLLPSNLL
jgi:hypothetical protein